MIPYNPRYCVRRIHFLRDSDVYFCSERPSDFQLPTMAEILGTVANVIDLLCKAKGLYQKFKDVKDLPKAFATISAQIDLATSIFEKIKNDTSLVAQLPELKAAIKRCESDAKDLNAIYEVVSKHEQSKWWQRYLEHVKGLGEDRCGAVEKVWGRLLDGVKLLADRYRLEDAARIERAIAEVKDLPSSLEAGNAGVTYFNTAETVAVQGTNHGEITMGNKIMGDYHNNNNYGTGKRAI